MRDKEFIDLSNAYNKICEQSYGIDASKYGGPDKLLQKMVDEKKRRGDKDGGGEVVKSGLQKANYEPEGELVLEKDETEEGITGLPIPKKKMSPAKRHKFEQKRREERKKRRDDRVGDTFSQHRMTGSRGHGSEYEVNPRVSYRHNEEYLIGYLLDEGFASDEKSAQAIAGAMGEEWKQSIVEQRVDVGGGRTVGPVAGAIHSILTGNLPKSRTYVPPSTQTPTNRPPAVPSSKDDSGKLTDFGAGGGKEKMKKTGMTVGQVERQGRMNRGNYSG